MSRSGPGATSVQSAVPRSIGSFNRGSDLLSGRYRMGADLIDAPGRLLWDVLPEGVDVVREAHGFSWLDDLAAVPLPEAERIARAWVESWVDRFGTGKGPGWTADLAGRRALRLVLHGEMLQPVPIGAALERHVGFLQRRAAAAPAGMPRLEALVGLVHAILALDPEGHRVAPVMGRLDTAAETLILRDGSIATRNPAALARALLLLGWTAEIAGARGHVPGRGLTSALTRGAHTLRGLTQPDGRLPRFHGGDEAPGLADLAIAATGTRRQTSAPMAMGFARLRHGRTGLVLDAAAPPDVASATAHASTLALELTVGRRPVIVNCGPGARFGPRWARVARTTASHSTLSIEGFSSSRLGAGRHRAEGSADVRLNREDTETGTRLVAAHDGYLSTHGLWHERIVELSRDGRRLAGQDALVAETSADRRCFDRARRRAGPPRFAIRFHLAPDVEPSLDMGGHAVSLLLPSGALWVFMATMGHVRLAVESSIVFRADAIEPVESRQIVLFSSTTEYDTRIEWELADVSAPGSPRRDIQD